jgi:hypothetical protein
LRLAGFIPLIFPDRRDHRLKLCAAPQCISPLLAADPALPRAAERGLDAARREAIDVDLTGLKAPSDSVCGRNLEREHGL